MPNSLRLPTHLLVAPVLLLFAASSAHAAISVGLTPSTQSVTPGTDFDVFLDVTSPGSAFNGFEVVVSFDPSALTLLPLGNIALQQGCLMTGVCSSACGNTFHRFATAADSAVVNDVLLCNGVSLQGPGNLYKLRFHASNTVQTTSLTIRRVNFFDAGLLTGPVVSSGAQVGIGVAVGVEPRSSGVLRPVVAQPNPARGQVRFVSEAQEVGRAEADIIDLQGRLVQHIGSITVGPSGHFTWDGRDAQGDRAPAGLYLVKLRNGGDIRTSRFILLQ
jgi:hypothetical protein